MKSWEIKRIIHALAIAIDDTGTLIDAHGTHEYVEGEGRSGKRIIMTGHKNIIKRLENDIKIYKKIQNKLIRDLNKSRREDEDESNSICNT